MKYMGSKRALLNNGLGRLISKQLPKANRVVDPFCGAGAVIYFIAENYHKKIIAGDLQKFAVILASAVISRTQKIYINKLERIWLSEVTRKISRSKLYSLAEELDNHRLKNVELWVKKSRLLCKARSNIG